jgi:hypothetical protein
VGVGVGEAGGVDAGLVAAVAVELTVAALSASSVLALVQPGAVISTPSTINANQNRRPEVMR